ncbi:MAG: hypothetical protein JSW61_05895 [Candidatus Thorarchaeota archaeon]|nr:MAG: hypothetical protein JSW61_05895 [Candidatus Thorarchaeota archaeon]
MSPIELSRDTIVRISVFIVIYTLFGLLIPIQGYVSISFAIGTLITAVLYGFALYYMNTNIPLGRKARILITWIAVYVIQMLNPVLEGIFFTTQFEGQPELAFGAVVFGLVLTLPTALVSGVLFSPTGEVTSFDQLRKKYFIEWTSSQFAVRFIIASMLWLVIYYTIGTIIAPLVLPYYTDGGVGYDLTLPAAEIVILLQTVRGFIYVLSVFPIVISVKLDKKPLAIILVALLYIAGALAVFVISEQFPVYLRFVHGIELFVDSLIAGTVISFILGKSDKSIQIID